MAASEVTIPALSDYHVHLREGAMLRLVAPYTARSSGRAMLMPNLVEPLDSPARLAAYQAEVGPVLPTCGPLWTFKITRQVARNLDWLAQFRRLGCVAGKLYPEGVTTNSEGGVDRATMLDLSKPGNWLLPLLGAMADLDLVLSIHPEMPGEFVLDREEKCLPFVAGCLALVPHLRIVLEHITTDQSVWFVSCGPRDRLAATITAHHLLMTLDDVLGDQLRPHSFCKPVAKRPQDRRALQEAAFSGAPRFFLGSDSAPHPIDRKECDHGCAGCFTAPVLPEVLVGLFDEAGALDRLPSFATRNGDRFYRQDALDCTLTLRREDWQVPGAIKGNGVRVVPWLAGAALPWRLVPQQ